MKGSRFRFNVVALVCVLGAGATGAETVMEKSVRLIGRRHFTAPENAVREGAAAPDPDPGLIVEGELYVLPDFSVKKRTVMEGRDLDTRMAKLRKGFARYPGLLRMPAQHKGLALYLLREDEDLRREGGDWGEKLSAIYRDDLNAADELHEIMLVTVLRRKRSR